MKRKFNVTGSCNPQKHYMVSLDDRVRLIKEKYVDEGSYFVINRGRQYGKTTTLNALAKYLEQDYVVLALDFQKMSTKKFGNESIFSMSFTDKLCALVSRKELPDKEHLLGVLRGIDFGSPNAGLDELFVGLSRFCEDSPRPVVLIIDEVDSAGNNQVFIDFLAQLRGYYLERENMPIFHSVVLAGVYDIKSLKLKFRPESEHQYNSPWNIAADFDVKMSFSAGQIASMLEEYEADSHTGMDIPSVAEEIYQYTSGYPYLVSAICKYLDEDLLEENEFDEFGKMWSKGGIERAVKSILKRSLPLFESMVRQMDIYKGLRNMLEDIIYCGKRVSFSSGEQSIHLGVMFGFLKEADDRVVVSNRIFEMYLLNLFTAQEAGSDAFSRGDSDSGQFVKNNRLDMDLVLKEFVEYFHEIYGDNDEKFVEAYGRKFFLLYLKPIINGTGNYYLEAQTRDARRTDVIVDYAGEQFVIEMKIWRGNEYNERGERQLTDYLEYFHQKKGYMLSFNFNKKKEVGMKELQIGDKTIVEAVV